MCRRSLPLNALRAFEVAARHKSLAKAAEELSVTPAAIHHQVKSLEVLLGVTLFVRSGNALTLTKAATAALPTLEGAFDLLSLATEKMRQHESGGTLSLAVCPSFAQKWLIPRLNRFREDFEGIELRISTTTNIPDLNSSEVDIAIGYGPEDRFRYQGVLADRLMGDEILPVCSPDFRKRHRLKGETDFLDLVLLHDDRALFEQGIDWNSWLSATGISSDSLVDNIRFDSTALAIDAALAGQGVALARLSLVADDLAEGRLVRLSKKTLTVNGGYFISNLELISEQPKVIAFKEWIFAEISLGKVRAATPKTAAVA
ncbi:LysR substrate-binding domain-containing protein [Dongia soli]|uniref:LysR substrate-binding domain-containing protein n=1 Tax=Dongia soli TaxID=600628 RepID=A0ABU5EFV9_9PROT|nr:LysR substrate-binding domain-containing protein [Dongia soli]MDY0884405.1 LysR substrate-binding domain-containing protein [Dongia soli]